MARTAVLLARSSGSWTGSEVDPPAADDLDDLGDQLRETARRRLDAADDAVVLLLVDADEEWLGVVRVDGDDDPRAFVGDARAAEDDELAALLVDEPPPVGDLDDEETSAARVTVAPGGDVDLLHDLGTPGDDLVALVTGEGLPADVMTTICERAGCADVLDDVRPG